MNIDPAPADSFLEDAAHYPGGHARGVVFPRTAQDIADALAARGYEVDRRRIELEHPIKSLGHHTVGVRLHPEVRAEVHVSVEPE